ncbi:Paired amphipathic helix protein Sin3a [Trichinella zimbabwensis]|uniref:Paired amphipathic helix protein Sin3a n=1 Tax=Trichinella zimbabwensis TaxID=268475 RepID=A0A0V1HT43_9BILA|nr:Paired amphipathic helix protein Sin3a [Trichinella zimbabwensis]
MDQTSRNSQSITTVSSSVSIPHPIYVSANRSSAYQPSFHPTIRQMPISRPTFPPAISVGSPSVRSQMPASSYRWMLNSSAPSFASSSSNAVLSPEVLAYIEKVRVQFMTNPSVYLEFLETLEEQRKQKIDTLTFVKRLLSLFLDCPHLIVNMKDLLPSGFWLDDRSNHVLLMWPNGQMMSLSKSDIIAERQAATTSRPPIVSSDSTVVSSVMQAAKQPANQAEEFNRALAYVNKIKMRYANKPEIYSQFLEILNSYQKCAQQSSIQSAVERAKFEEKLYKTVTKLFSHDADLLSEFTRFLPTASSIVLQNSRCVSAAMTHSRVDTPLRSVTAIKTATSAVSKASSVMNVGPGTSTKSQMINFSLKNIPKKKLKADPIFIPESSTSALTEEDFVEKLNDIYNGLKTHRHFIHFIQSLSENKLKAAFLLESVQAQYHQTVMGEWIERALKAIKSNTFQWNLEYKSLWKQKNLRDIELAELQYLGGSYYLLSDEYRNRPRSGNFVADRVCDFVIRYDCATVLNYDCFVVSLALTDEQLYMSIKKTAAEEAIFDVEDDRYELDAIISINRSVIDSLTDIQSRLERMTKEEMKAFRLDDRLGTNSVSVPARALRRVFGRTYEELFNGLKLVPHAAVSLILEGLQEKATEWRSKRDLLSHEWRESSKKNYWKALDSRGVTFRQWDLRRMRTRSLVNEIEAVRAKRKERGIRDEDAGGQISIIYPECTIVIYDPGRLLMQQVKKLQSWSSSSSSPVSTFNFVLVLFSCLYIDINYRNKERIRFVLQIVVPVLLGIPPDDGPDSNHEFLELDTTKTVKLRTSLSGRRGRGRGRGSSLKRTMKGSCEDLEGKDVAQESIVHNPSEEDDDDESCFLNMAAYQFPVQVVTSGSKALGDTSSTLLLPQPWYVFFRLHNLFAHRLTKLFEYSRKFVCNCNNKKLKHLFWTPKLKKFFLCNSKRMLNPKEIYNMAMALIIRYLECELDSDSFEDELRHLCTTQANEVYTVDKMVQILIRQLNLIVGDAVSVNLFKLYGKFREKQQNTTDPEERLKNQKEYEAIAMKSLADQNLYKISFYPESRAMTFDLVSQESYKIPQRMNVFPMQESATNLLNPVLSFYLTTLTLNERRQIQGHVWKLNRLPFLSCKRMQIALHCTKAEECRLAFEADECDDFEDSVYADLNIDIKFHPTSTDEEIEDGMTEIVPIPLHPYFTCLSKSKDFFVCRSNELDVIEKCASMQRSFFEICRAWNSREKMVESDDISVGSAAKSHIDDLFLGKGRDRFAQDGTSKLIVPVNFRPPTNQLVLYSDVHPSKMNNFALPNDIFQESKQAQQGALLPFAMTSSPSNQLTLFESTFAGEEFSVLYSDSAFFCALKTFHENI